MAQVRQNGESFLIKPVISNPTRPLYARETNHTRLGGGLGRQPSTSSAASMPCEKRSPHRCDARFCRVHPIVASQHLWCRLVWYLLSSLCRPSVGRARLGAVELMARSGLVSHSVLTLSSHKVLTLLFTLGPTLDPHTLVLTLSPRSHPHFLLTISSADRRADTGKRR